MASENVSHYGGRPSGHLLTFHPIPATLEANATDCQGGQGTLQPPEHQHHQRTSARWVLPSPLVDGDAESSIVEVRMTQMQHEVHDYVTPGSEFITNQHFCLVAVSPQQPLVFSLGSFTAPFTFQSCSAGG